MKKFLSVLLVVSLLITTAPVVVSADSNDYVVTIKDAPIRTGAKEKSDIITWVEGGTLLLTTGSCYNIHLNKWYQVVYDGQIGYIYSRNVIEHVHDYQTVNVRDISFEVCDCGDYHIYANTHEKEIEGETILAGALTMLPTSVMMSENYYLVADALVAAPAIGSVDFIAPYGDVLAACIVVAAVAYALATPMPEVEDVLELISEQDFIEAVKGMTRICTANDYWIVQRYPGGLKYVDRYNCLLMVEAFVASYIFGLDVWTVGEPAAAALASMGGAVNICERDKDQETYFYHYHYGNDRLIHSHIFFGTNDYGEMPS